MESKHISGSRKAGFMGECSKITRSLVYLPHKIHLKLGIIRMMGGCDATDTKFKRPPDRAVLDTFTNLK